MKSNMKKNLIALGAMLMATLSLTNCAKEFQTAPEVEKTPYTIYARHDAATKTVNDSLGTKWSEKDSLTVFHAPAGTDYYSSSSKFVLTDLEACRFETEELNGSLTESDDWFAIYPYNELIHTPANDASGYLAVGSPTGTTQVQDGNDNMSHIGGVNYPMWGIAREVSGEDLPDLSMKHLSSLVEVKVTNDAAVPMTVRTLSLTAPEDIIGTYYIDFSSEEPVFTSSGDRYVSNVARLVVKEAEALEPGQTASYYVAIKPFTAYASTELKLSVNGLERSIELTNDVTFHPGKIKTMNFSLDEAAIPISIAEVIEIGKGASVLTSGIVVAKYNRGFLIEDGSGSILVYTNALSGVAIGDEVNVVGSTTIYAGLLQITNPDVEIISVENEVIYPDPVVLDGAGLDSMLECDVVTFVTYTGRLNVSGSYYNINVEGAESAVGSASYPLASLGMSEMSGRTVTVEGYFIGVSSGKYINTMVTYVEVGEEPEPDVPEIVVATVEEVLAAEVSTDVWYEMTGTISNIKNTTYGNFDLVDETGSIYVYGLTATQVEKNDKSFASLGLKEGDIVTIVGTRAEYKGTPQIGGPAYYVSHVEGEEPEELVPGPYKSNILWTLGANASDQKANVNDESELPVLKLGTASKVGEATFSLPAGTTKVGFYAVSWKEKPATVALKCNDVQIASVDAPVNEGATGNPTYTIEADEASCYFEIEINAEEDTKYTLTTTSSNKRVIIWGLNYYTADGIGEDQVEEEPEPEIIDVTISEFHAAEVSDDVLYRVTGTISNIEEISESYNNATLTICDTDGTELYVFRMKPAEGNIVDLGLTVGDELTVVGKRAEYEGASQMGSGVYESHVDGVEPEPEPEPEPEDPEDPADGTVASAVFAEKGYANAQVVADETIWLDDNVSLVFSQGGASTAPTYYDSGSAIRMYQNGAILDVEANGKTITLIELTFSNNHYYLAPDCGELSAEASVRTWTGESTAVKFTSTGTDKNHRAYVSAIKVVYAD